MQDACDHQIRIRIHGGENLQRFNGMQDIGTLGALAYIATVAPYGKIDGLIELGSTAVHLRSGGVYGVDQLSAFILRFAHQINTEDPVATVHWRAMR